MSVQLHRAGQLTVSGRMVLAMHNGRDGKVWRNQEFHPILSHNLVFGNVPSPAHVGIDRYLSCGAASR